MNMYGVRLQDHGAEQLLSVVKLYNPYIVRTFERWELENKTLLETFTRPYYAIA